MTDTNGKQPRPTLPVSAMCQWFRGGDLDGDPLAAMVTASNPQGMLRLNVWQPGGREPFEVTAARHVSDPDVKERPELIKEPQVGLWDFTPPFTVYHMITVAGPEIAVWNPEKHCYEPARDKDVARAEPTPPPSLPARTGQQAEGKILELRKKYGKGNSVRIAEEVTAWSGLTWSYQKVNAFLARHAKQTKADKTAAEPVNAQ